MPNLIYVSPINGEEVSYQEIKLSWEGTDPNGDKLIYNVYLGESEEGLKRIDTTYNNYYVIKNLKQNTYYYWRIVVDDGRGGVYKGEIETFKTKEIIQVVYPEIYLFFDMYLNRLYVKGTNMSNLTTIHLELSSDKNIFENIYVLDNIELIERDMGKSYLNIDFGNLGHYFENGDLIYFNLPSIDTLREDKINIYIDNVYGIKEAENGLIQENIHYDSNAFLIDYNMPFIYLDYDSANTTIAVKGFNLDNYSTFKMKISCDINSIEQIEPLRENLKIIYEDYNESGYVYIEFGMLGNKLDSSSTNILGIKLNDDVDYQNLEVNIDYCQGIKENNENLETENIPVGSKLVLSGY